MEFERLIEFTPHLNPEPASECFFTHISGNPAKSTHSFILADDL